MFIFIQVMFLRDCFVLSLHRCVYKNNYEFFFERSFNPIFYINFYFSIFIKGPNYPTWIKKGDDRLNTLKRTHYAFDHLARMKKGFAFDHLARMRKSYAFDHLARMKKGLAFDHLARMKKEGRDGKYEYILCVLSLRDYQDYQHC